MLYLCPHCGHNLPHGLSDGLAWCETCRSSLDSSRMNRLMSAAWMVYRQNPQEIDGIAKAIGLTEAESMLVEAFMMDGLFSIDEFRAAVRDLGIRD